MSGDNAMGARSEALLRPLLPLALLAQVQLLDDRAVTLDIDLLQVAQKVSSVADHLQHAAAAVVVLVVALEVLGQGVDAMRQDRDLNLRGAGVTLMGGVLRNDSLLFFFQHGFIHLSVYYAQPQRQVGECHRGWLCPATEKASCIAYYSTTVFKSKGVFEIFLLFI